MALKILLADDSMTAQNMGKKILTDAGYEVVAVSNGAAAVKKIAEVSPHLCILDIYMPGYTGLEVCEKVKSSPVTARMPVLLTVGKMEPYKPEEGARVRADGVIVKPFEASELLRAVQRFSSRIPGALTGNPAQTSSSTATAAPVPPPPPVNTPATYEKTVKLTREQLQAMIDPNSPKWHAGTAGPEVAPAAAARTDVPTEVAHTPAMSVGNVVANMKTASTSDAMPTFAVAAVAEETPAIPADVQPAMVDVSASSVAVAEAPAVPETPAPSETPALPETPAAAVETTLEAALPNASAVLAGFVDYLIAQEKQPASAPDGGSVAPVIAEAPPAAVEVAAPATEFAVQAEAPAVPEAPAAPEAPSAEPTLVQASSDVRSTGSELLTSDFASAQPPYDIPARDPALDVAPEVSITPTPDPQFESAVDVQVANATENGLQPTSRASEAEGVVTSDDPNLSPMEGLSDAVLPLEGGRYTPPEPAPAPVADTAVEAAAIVEAVPVEAAAEPAPAVEKPVEVAAVSEAAPAVEKPAELAVVPEPAPVVEAPAPPPPPPPPTGKKGKKGKEMRAIPAATPAVAPEPATPPVPVAAEPVVVENPVEVVAEASAPAIEKPAETPVAEKPVEAKAEAPSEIDAVLDLIGQTIPGSQPPAPAPAAVSAVEEMTAPTPLIAAATPRVWMAEEVALSEAEASISLENEMRAAYAAQTVEHQEAPEVPVISAEVVAPPVEAAVAVAPAEEPVRDDKTAPLPANPDPGGTPPASGASPTQELAAAMAAAFGGALPKEDLARAEETQSISEEVRRFALGDAYKAKPTFGGAAIDDGEEQTVTKEKLAAAISRALDRLKPQLVAEILKELEAPKEE